MKGGVHNLPAYPICYLQPLPKQSLLEESNW